MQSQAAVKIKVLWVLINCGCTDIHCEFEKLGYAVN